MNGTSLLVPGLEALSKQARKLSQHDAESLARKASQMLCNPSVKRQIRGQVEKERREKLKKPAPSQCMQAGGSMQENAKETHDGFERPEIKPRTQQLATHLSNIALKSVRQLQYKANTSAMSESDRQTVGNTKRMTKWTRFRRFAQRTLRYRHFDTMIAIAVLVDTIIMAFDSMGNVTLGAIDLLFTLFFSFEMVLRFTAYHDHKHHRSFFRSKWSFVYVGLLVACILSYCILGMATMSQWRAIRGLKAYRCFTAVKGIRRILKTITKAVPLLANVGALAFFFLLMFSIIGLEAFPSVFDMQCALPTTPANETLSLEDEVLSYPVIYCSDNMKCAPDFICVAVDSSETSSYHSFQTGFASFLLVFQVMALDGWIDAAMEPAIQSTSSLAVVFFVFLIILFVFLVLNLFVAVITTAFMGHGDTSTEDIATDKQDDTAHGPIFDMRKMNKEDEEQHLYMVLGTTIAVEQAAVRGSLSSRENENDDMTQTNANQIDQSTSTSNRGLSTRRLTSATSLPVLTTMSFINGNAIDLPPGTTIETQFREWLQSVPGASGRLRRFILSENFADILMCFIVINTIALMCEYPNMGHQWQTFFDVIEFMFSVVFAIELLLKFYAFQSVRLYFYAYERWFDAIVVSSSLSISILKKLSSGSLTQVSWMDNVSILRTLRIGRLMWKWKGTRKLIESVMKSSRAMFNLLIFLGLYLLVHSVVAMQLFGVVHEMPRRNFHGFFHSFVAMFQVLSGDKWAEVMNSILERESLLFAPFFIVYIFFGQFVVLNIFIAVILENFAISEEEAYQLQLERVLAIPKELQMYEKFEEVGVRAFYANNDMRQLEHVQDVKARRFLGVSERDNKPVGDNEAVHAKRFLSMDLIIPRIDQLLQSTGFKYFIILTIFLSCIGLAIDDPVIMFELTPSEMASQNNKMSVLSAINVFALVVFTLEFALKVASQGFGFRYIMRKLFTWYESQYYRSRFISNSRKVSNKKHYIEDPWNRLDFILLVVALLDEAFSLISNQKSRNSNLVKVLRVGRVLRPLRLFNQDGDMKLIMTSFVAALPAVGDVIVLCIGVFIIFGIAGRTLFSLKMYGCNDMSVLNRTMCTGFYEAFPIANSEVSVLTARVWVPYRARFDTLASSMIVLMELSSLKWIETAEFAMDIVGLDYQPEENYSMYYALYFIAFVFLGGFFLIRLFVGVLVEQFQRNNGTQMLTPSQKCWVELERHMLLLKPRYSAPEPQHKYRKKAFRLAKDNRFEQFMSVIIVLNMLFMLLNTAKAPPSSQIIYDNIDKLFVAMYTCEFLTKLVAFGGHFFRDSWHLFDAVILLGSYVSYLPGSSIHQISQIGRFFRVLRVMKFAKVSKGVRTVFRTFRASFSSICNVLLLLVLLLYIFAILGRQLFGTIKFGQKINHTMNFKTFGSAILTLFGLMAGGEWHLFMTDCMVEGASCATIGADSDCGQYYAAWIYFLAFVVAIVYVFLNLFIAVILENFRSCYVKDISPVTLEDFEGYQEVFEKFDKDHKGVIPIHLLARFLHDLPPNLRVSTTGNRIAYLHLRFEIEHVLLAPATPQSIPFFNALLRTICIHHMGIRALSYEQQRDRVKQIFVIKEKVANMLVKAMIKGVIERKRAREKRQMIYNLSKTKTMVHRTSVSKQHETTNTAAVNEDQQDIDHKGTNALENTTHQDVVSLPQSTTLELQDKNQKSATEKAIAEMVDQSVLATMLPEINKPPSTSGMEHNSEGEYDAPSTSTFQITDSLFGGDAVQLDVDKAEAICDVEAKIDNYHTTENNLLKPPLQSKAIRLPKLKMDTSKVSPI